LSRERMKEKYFGMVRNAMFVTDLEAKADFEARNKMASIQYVPLFLNAISDSSIKVSDGDIEKYYNAHKEEYKREDGRNIEYVTFDINATKEDTVAAEKWINQQVEAFRKTKNDSSYVTRVGRTSFKNQYLPRGNYPANIEEQIFAADSGTMIGPYFEEGAYKLAKVMGSKNDTVNYYKASHILIRPNGPTPQDSAEAQKKAKDVFAKIKGGADFNQMAIENSMDPSNAGKGGDLGWFRDGQMVKKFNDAVKNARKGDVLLVTTEFGTHIIKVTENKSNKLVKAAIIERPVNAGAATQDNAYALASKFRTEAQTGEEFNAAVAKMKLTKRLAENLKPNDRNIAGLENPRELIRWAYAFDTKVGDVSEPKVIGNKYVVAHVTKAYEAGYTPLDEIKDQVKVFAIREKKKELLVEKMQKAMEGTTSLDNIAKNLQSSVSSAENVMFGNPFIPNLSNEPALVGTVFGLKANQVSKPVSGENGVYVVKVVNFSDIKAPEKFDAERKMMAAQQAGQVQDQAMEALRKKADVKDLRYFYY
ncbi:MAG: peptidylprolyl isomerase, partial [Bacteroidia bacterium]